MKAYLMLAKSHWQTLLMYRAGFFLQFVSHTIVLVINYFLWKAVYAGTETLNSLDFNTAFSTVTLSQTLFAMFQTHTQHEINEGIHNGNIARELLKPVDHQLMLFSKALGGLVMNTLIVALPSLLLLVFIFGIKIPVGINLFYFFISIGFSFLICFISEYIVGVISFYTIAVWGVSATWSSITLILSGALIPLEFFPPLLRQLADILPFRAMFAVPMKMLFSCNTDIHFYAQGLLLQLVWIIGMGLFSRLFFGRAIRKITVQGG